MQLHGGRTQAAAAGARAGLHAPSCGVCRERVWTGWTRRAVSPLCGARLGCAHRRDRRDRRFAARCAGRPEENAGLKKMRLVWAGGGGKRVELNRACKSRRSIYQGHAWLVRQRVQCRRVGCVRASAWVDGRWVWAVGAPPSLYNTSHHSLICETYHKMQSFCPAAGCISICVKSVTNGLFRDDGRFGTPPRSRAPRHLSAK